MEVFQSGKSLKRPSTAESKEDGSAKKAKVLQHPVRSVSDSASVADKLRLERRRLPIFWGRRTLLDEVFKNENVIIMSETGSGKTTQIPQYVLEAGRHFGGFSYLEAKCHN